MLAYALHRIARALLTAAGLILVVGLFAGPGRNCAASACLDAGELAAWLGRLGRLDLGRNADNVAVSTAIGSAALPSLLLLAGAALIVLLAGWGGGLLLSGSAVKVVSIGYTGRYVPHYLVARPTRGVAGAHAAGRSGREHA